MLLRQKKTRTHSGFVCIAASYCTMTWKHNHLCIIQLRKVRGEESEEEEEMPSMNHFFDCLF